MARSWHVDFGWHSVLFVASAVMVMVFVVTRSRRRSQPRIYRRDLLPAWRKELDTVYEETEEDFASDSSGDIQLRLQEIPAA